MQAIKNNNGDSSQTNNINNNYSKTMRRTAPVTFALMSVRSPYTKEHYKGKLKEFFDFIGLSGNSLDDQGQAFLAQAIEERNKDHDTNTISNDYWVEDTILSFLDYQKERVYKGELGSKHSSDLLCTYPSFLYCLSTRFTFYRLERSLKDTTRITGLF